MMMMMMITSFCISPLLPVFLHWTEQPLPTSFINAPFLRHSTSRHLIPYNDLPLFNTLSFNRCTSSILLCLSVFVSLMIQVLWDNMMPYRLASRQLRVLTSLRGVTSQTTSVFSKSAVRISDFVFVFWCIHKRNLGFGRRNAPQNPIFFVSKNICFGLLSCEGANKKNVVTVGRRGVRILRKRSNQTFPSL
jgi:hypothetical protein